MSILSRSWNYFLKSRVITYGCMPIIFTTYFKIVQAERMMVEQAKQGFENPEEAFMDHDAMAFYECRFYSYLGRNFRPSAQYLSKQYKLLICYDFLSEAEQYDTAVEQFTKFEDLSALYDQLNRLYWEQKGLYLWIIREITTHNLWNRSRFTSKTYVDYLEQSIKNYIEVVKSLDAYPEWQKRVEEEIGYFQHMIYSTVNIDETGRQIYAKFDRHYYFK